MHLDPLLAVALARLAPAALLIEAEPPGVVAAHFGFRQPAEEFADQVEDTGVRRRVGRRRVAERVLIDVDDLVDLLQADDIIVRRPGRLGTVQSPRKGIVKHLIHERRFPGPAHAGDGHEAAERNLHVDVAQVVLSRADHL